MNLNKQAAAGALAASLVGALVSPAQAAEPMPTNPREQVWAAEQAFARTMAVRDLLAFGQYVDDEAIFFTGPEPLRGKAAVVTGWAGFFQGATAPFSWEPDSVEVLASGTLAFSSGPVRDASGKVVARFNSIWRQQAPGVWRVVFDKGSPLPSADKKP